MAGMMKAAVVREFGKPLTIEEYPIPTPGPGQILVATPRPVCATPICTPPMAIGRSNPIHPSSRP